MLEEYYFPLNEYIKNHHFEKKPLRIHINGVHGPENYMPGCD
jgi:hypothetical protein